MLFGGAEIYWSEGEREQARRTQRYKELFRRKASFLEMSCSHDKLKKWLRSQKNINALNPANIKFIINSVFSVKNNQYFGKHNNTVFLISSEAFDKKKKYSFQKRCKRLFKKRKDVWRKQQLDVKSSNVHKSGKNQVTPWVKVFFEEQYCEG